MHKNNFDYFKDDPIMDDPKLDEYNVNQKVQDFITNTNNQASQYKTNNLIMTLGNDFQYSNAHMWYKNLDKLIYYVNKQQESGSKINIFYSTPSCYLYTLNNANISWTVKYDDFFPYASRPHAFWTGYFTSRAALKGYVRRVNNFLQIVRQISALSGLNNSSDFEAIGVLERAMGVAQHHDAVSGTERQHVAYDYAKRLAKGVSLGFQVIIDSLKTMLSNSGQHINDDMHLDLCLLLNISECRPIEDNNGFLTFVYNPLPRSVSYFVRLPTVTPDYSVFDYGNLKEIPSNFFPIYPETLLIPERNSTANFDLVFEAQLPSLGFNFFFIPKVFGIEPF